MYLVLKITRTHHSKILHVIPYYNPHKENKREERMDGSEESFRFVLILSSVRILLYRASCRLWMVDGRTEDDRI